MKKMLTRILVLGLVSVLALGALAGCANLPPPAAPADGAAAPPPVTGNGDATAPPATTIDPAVPNNIPITIMANAAGAGLNNANLMRDLLVSAGFDVTLDLQPDFAGWVTQIEARNFDIAVTSWTTIGGSPDYAVRPIFHSSGGSNWSRLNNPRIDYLIELAGGQTLEEAVETYRLLEYELVVNNAYIFPLYRAVNDTSANITVLDQSSINLPGIVHQWWHLLDFVDPADRDTRPLRKTQIWPHITSFDPIATIDLTGTEINAQIYINLVNANEHGQLMPDGSLSWQFVIAEGNQAFYFVLRDDVNFAMAENMQAVDTGVRVGACDVIFSLQRAGYFGSVPSHQTSWLFGHHDDMSILTDVAHLDNVRCTQTGQTLRQVMEGRTPTAITALTDDKTQANNAGGVYQVVRITTHEPFPQMLNYLAHNAAGILSKEQVSRINYFPMDEFDFAVHVLYGSQAAFTLGDNYAPHIWASGAYVPIFSTDYNIYFQANPGFKPGDYWAPRIRSIDMLFIPDPDAAISAFRAGEIYTLHNITPAQHPLIHADPNLYMLYGPSFFHAFAITNRDPGRVLENVDVRLAILHSISQDDIIAFYHGIFLRASSTLSAMVDTGIIIERDMARVEYHLRRFWESQ